MTPLRIVETRQTVTVGTTKFSCMGTPRTASGGARRGRIFFMQLAFAKQADDQGEDKKRYRRET
jgi:hypothetical protein